ncbi:TonB-dependent receptor [Undibacterium fentianense]|uniref:TonB-dependent receptor n=1 Tax=Undibacterium fentianense TaxID=2828728 RepID=A0A941E0U0_9BURK|nr:TonB-dependent receptor [Undibacterium fentianense]MBR7800335.1 TonB-dependent receptor [Undibacterium fentianense]
MSKRNMIFRKNLVAHALVLAFGGSALTIGVAPMAFAQSNATSTIYGQVASPAGATVQINNTDTGLKRTINLDAAGRYSVTALPAGHYRVELVRDGKVVSTQEFDAVIGQGMEASFAAAAAQQVTVSAVRTRIDISNTNNGAIFTAKELAKLPVATNLNSIILLAPNTTRADAAYGGVSFGGSGVSENAFYVNGFPVTNPLTQLGSSELPFGAIGQASIITGGFGAEFGRSIGGVLNVTTKSGTNKWETGVTASFTPQNTRSKTDDIYYPVTGDANNKATDGTIHFRRNNNTDKQSYYGAYLGGPIIEDKLFMFLAVDQTKTDTGRNSSAQSTTLTRDGWTTNNTENTRYLAKFDFNINDDHRLEWTSIGDNNTQTVKTFGLNDPTPSNAMSAADYMSSTPGGTKYTEFRAKNAGASGSVSNALKYTGNFTDNLTFTTLYGVGSAPRATTYEDYDVNSNLRSVGATTPRQRVPALDAQGLYKNYQKFSGNIAKPGDDEIKSFRADLEWKAGQHTIRGGIDHNVITSENAGVFRAGGGSWTYRNVPTGSEFSPVLLSGGRAGIVGNFGGYGTQGYYVRLANFTSVTDASATQSAQYIEDRYQVTKNLLIVAGIRNEQYTNKDGEGRKFIDMKNQIAPRLSASWDVNGDSSLKVFGSTGRYYLQLPTQVAARAASRSTLTSQDFTYTGIDNLGQPTGLVAINTPYSVDGEYGNQKNINAVVMKDLKPNFQDEVTLGFEKAYSPTLNFGAKVTYRKLGAGIDDNCDTRRAFDFAKKNGIPVVSKDFMSCYIFNPGSDATVFIDGHDQFGQIIPGAGKWATFSAAELGFPKASRSYKALDLFVEHPMRNGWYGKVNYTWSRSYGNMEGQTRSDTGQTDVAVTAAWDFPEFTPYSTGLLPNDRTHQFKAFGFYEVTPEFNVGANLLVQSGRPKVCLGTNIDAENGDLDPLGKIYGGPGYGAEYFWCGGKPAPRGSLGRLPFEKRLDLSFAYKPVVLKGISFKVDVFNALNSQTILARQEAYDDGSGEGILSNYGEGRTFQTPRTMKFSVEYHHKF